jgi:predicted house-cleaning noncanonical NTP pyrophosphatase (MazG superfamily)
MNKLVRDKIVDIIKSEGRDVNFEVLNDSDYLQALKNKLQEESLEVINSNSKEETLAELADLQELIDCILIELKLSKKELKAAQKLKNLKRGSFKKRLFLKD